MSKETQKTKSFSALYSGAPAQLFWLTIVSLVITSFVQFQFYSETVYKSFGGGRYAFGAALIHALFINGLRFGLMSKSIDDFQKNNRLAGFVGLLGNLVLTSVCFDEVSHIATHWAAGNQQMWDAIYLGLSIVVWSGFALEVRLVFSEINEIANEESGKTLEDLRQILGETQNECEDLIDKAQKFEDKYKAAAELLEKRNADYNLLYSASENKQQNIIQQAAEITALTNEKTRLVSQVNERDKVIAQLRDMNAQQAAEIEASKVRLNGRDLQLSTVPKNLPPLPPSVVRRQKQTTRLL